MARSGGGLNSAAAEQPSDAEQLPLHCITGSRFLGLPFYGKLGCLLGKDCANSWPVLRTFPRLSPSRPRASAAACSLSEVERLGSVFLARLEEFLNSH